MNVYVATNSLTYTLSQAVLIHTLKNSHNTTTGAPFITCHDVIPSTTPGKAPELGAARPITTDFVRSLIKSMSPKQALQAEFLPENLLVKTNDTLVWWTPEQHRPMYFSVAQGKATEVEGMSGKVFPHPALVFVVNDGRLFVRALKTNKRPTPDTDLFIAPYWNVYDTGSVCLGSMKHPRTYGISAIAGWENGFFDSYFAHPNTPLLTRHKEGIVDLWASLQGSTEKYPARTLVPAKQKLAGLLK